jgi:hypothetical protein
MLFHYSNASVERSSYVQALWEVVSESFVGRIFYREYIVKFKQFSKEIKL